MAERKISGDLSTGEDGAGGEHNFLAMNIWEMADQSFVEMELGNTRRKYTINYDNRKMLVVKKPVAVQKLKKSST